MTTPTPKASCFEHNHMTFAEYGMYCHLRRVGIKYGQIWFDGRKAAAEFVSTRGGDGKFQAYNLINSLEKKGWVVMLRKGTRNTRGIPQPSIYRHVEHDEWVETHPNQCRNASPSEQTGVAEPARPDGPAEPVRTYGPDILKDLDSNHSVPSKRPVRNRQMTGPYLANDQSVPTDEDLVFSYPCFERSGADPTEGKGKAGPEGEEHTCQPTVVVAESHFGSSAERGGSASPKSPQGDLPLNPRGDFKISNPPQGNQNEDNAERMIAANRLRQLDRKLSSQQIIREYGRVFERIRADAGKAYREREYKDNQLVSEAVFDTNRQHREAAVELFRIVGGTVVLSAWEKFLAHDNHVTVQSDGSGGSEEVIRRWLLRDFVEKYGDALKQSANPAA